MLGGTKQAAERSSSPLPWKESNLADSEGASVQELAKVSEELAAGVDEVQQREAELHAHQHDAKVADEVLRCRAAHDRYRDNIFRDTMATYAPSPFETSVPCHLALCFGILRSCWICCGCASLIMSRTNCIARSAMSFHDSHFLPLSLCRFSKINACA